ncbi:MAG: L,D-transpeptidase, partial [Puniceicoccales bacterium]|nr:L,D-transpeptidase [Puniceicoccales bacterium]
MFYERVEIICNDLGIAVTEQWLYIVVSEQRMYYYDRDRLKTSYRISTAKKGIGQIEDSEQTPLGLHKIEEKIGGGAPWGMVFISRKRTGKIFTEYGDWQ